MTRALILILLFASASCAQYSWVGTVAPVGITFLGGAKIAGDGAGGIVVTNDLGATIATIDTAGVFEVATITDGVATLTAGSMSGLVNVSTDKGSMRALAASDGTTAAVLTDATGAFAFSLGKISTPATGPLAMGSMAGSAATTEALTAFGVGALQASNAVADAGNSAFGSAALFSNTTGDSNSAVGRAALYSNTAGSSNSAFGRAALFSNTTGDSNSAVGREALRSNTTGSSNSAVGRDALRANTTGNNNAAVGVTALRSNTTGSSNSVVGREALFNNTTGNNNAAVGVSALRSNTTGTRNAALGYRAGYRNNTGNDNTIIGYMGVEPAAGAINRITVLGSEAARDVATGAADVLALGYRAGFLHTNQTNRAYIGGWDGTNQHPLNHHWEVSAVSALNHIQDFNVNRTQYRLPLATNDGDLKARHLDIKGYIDLAEIAEPAAPAAGTVRIYLDSASGKLSTKDSAGTTSVLALVTGGTISASTIAASDGTAAMTIANATGAVNVTGASLQAKKLGLGGAASAHDGTLSLYPNWDDGNVYALDLGSSTGTADSNDRIVSRSGTSFWDARAASGRLRTITVDANVTAREFSAAEVGQFSKGLQTSTGYGISIGGTTPTTNALDIASSTVAAAPANTLRIQSIDGDMTLGYNTGTGTGATLSADILDVALYIDLAAISEPDAPAVGDDRLYHDSTTGFLTYKQSGGLKGAWAVTPE